MKNKKMIQDRLEKLRSRYLAKYSENVRKRKYMNCKYNVHHLPKKLTLGPEEELSISPRKTNSLIVSSVKPDKIHLCTYGSEREIWSGDICDSWNDISLNCKYFSARVGVNDIEEEFNKLLMDDEYVLHNYPDIAALQWVLEDRIYKQPLGFWSNLLHVITVFFLKRTPTPPLLAPGSDCPSTPIPKDFWDDSESNTNP